MNTTDISDQHSIYKNPHVIVSGEFECRLFLLLRGGISPILLNKSGRKRHPEIMVQIGRTGRFVYRAVRIKREELSAIRNRPVIIQYE